MCSEHFEAKIEPLADPNLHIEWFKDGRPVTIGHRFRPIHDFGYVAMDIVGLITEDSGTYTIRATNNVGSCEATATLRCKSKFFLKPHFNMKEKLNCNFYLGINISQTEGILTLETFRAVTF